MRVSVIAGFPTAPVTRAKTQPCATTGNEKNQNHNCWNHFFSLYCMHKARAHDHHRNIPLLPSRREKPTPSHWQCRGLDTRYAFFQAIDSKMCQQAMAQCSGKL
jgi:hypothetical protein